MQRHIYLLLLPVLFMVISCKKDDVSGKPVAAATYLNIAYGSDPLQKTDVYLPAGRSTATTRVMVMIHGGAWTTGDKADFASFIDTVKKRWPSYAVFNINYRLSTGGTNVFPAQELDTKAAIEFIYNKRGEYLTGDNFTLVGASAGGHLALLQAYKYAVPVKVKCVVDFFGPTDLNALYNTPGFVPQSYIEEIIGATPVSDPQLYNASSPLNYVTNSAACPTIILQGTADPLVNPATQSRPLRNALQAASVPVQYVEYAGKGHGDDWGADIYTDAFNKIQAFINTYNP